MLGWSGLELYGSLRGLEDYASLANFGPGEILLSVVLVFWI